ncbi:MAG: SpoIIE family protein phosphatase [Giesbergeria sp.]|nr:SpoIIE family protein phosphatase [Giesbergeria sp.]
MLLRTRITLIVALGLLLIVLGLGSAGVLREQLLEQRLSTIALDGQTSLWGEVLAAEDRLLDQVLDQLVADDAFVSAAGERDAAALERLLRGARLLPGQPGAVGQLELIALLSTHQDPLWWGMALQRPLLDSVSVDRAVSGELISGLRMGSGNRPLVLSSRTVMPALRGSNNAQLPNGPVVIVLARHAQHALQRFTERTGAHANLIDLRGQLSAATDATVWQNSAVQISPRIAHHGKQTTGAITYVVNSTPITDLAGHTAGALVTLDDQSAAAAAGRFLERLMLGGTLVLVLAVLLGLNFYLGRSFRPLEHAITVLQALARGDTSVRLQHRGNDEIGRIAQAVVSLRRTAQELMASRALRERVRRRQERLIQRQLHHLADATDISRREEILGLLHTHSNPSAAQGDEELLRQLAAVMGDLTQRLIQQHQSLSSMVVELREALVTKTRLAGLEQELQIAAQVQLSILPRELPTDPRVQLHCHITPAREVGGDFYDYFHLDDEHLGFVMADVSGKGVPAALFMAITRTLLKATALFVTAPTLCIGKLNDLLAKENEQMMFVTIFYGVLHLPTGQVTYVNAGHNPPYQLLADSRVQAVPRTGGMAVAVSEDFPYREGRLTLAPGETLFLYTDGITEAFDCDAQEYGDARLEAVLQGLQQPQGGAGRRLPPTDLCNAVLADVHQFERGAPQADDITCMALRYQGKESLLNK